MARQENRGGMPAGRAEQTGNDFDNIEQCNEDIHLFFLFFTPAFNQGSTNVNFSVSKSIFR